MYRLYICVNFWLNYIKFLKTFNEDCFGFEIQLQLVRICIELGLGIGKEVNEDSR